MEEKELCVNCRFWRPKYSLKSIWAYCVIKMNNLIKTECPHQITQITTYYHFGCSCFEKKKI